MTSPAPSAFAAARSAALALGALLVLPLTLASPAAAATYCIGVSHPSCDAAAAPGATPGVRLAGTLALAAGSPAADVVRLGPGSYDAPSGGFRANGPGLELLGAGPATVLRDPSAGSGVTLSATSAVVHDMAVQPPPVTFGVGVWATGGFLGDVSIAGTGNQEIGMYAQGGAQVARVRTRDVLYGVWTLGGSPAGTLSDSDIGASAAGVAALAAGAPLAVSRVTVTIERPGAAATGILLVSSGNSVRNSVVRAPAGTTGIQVLCDTSGPSSTTATLTHVTVDMPGPASPALESSCAGAGLTAAVTLADSILDGTMRRSASGGGTANVIASRTIADVSASTGSGPGSYALDDVRDVAPGFAGGGDLHLAPGSPAVDTADPSAASAQESDRDGLPRTADGNGDGILRRDLGAYELQPPPVAPPAGNLLLTPGAEAAGAATGTVVAPLPPAPWTRTQGSLTFAAYGSSFFPLLGVATANAAGAATFIGGPNAAVSRAEQLVDLSASAAAIDTGAGRIDLSGLLGGYGAEGDAARVVAELRDGGGTLLGALAIGPVTPEQRNGATTLLRRAASAALPAGTRAVLVTLIAERGRGDAYNDATFDNLALTASLPALAPPGGGGPSGGSSPGGGPPASGGAPGGGRSGGGPGAARARFDGLRLRGATLRASRRWRVPLRATCAATAVRRCRGTLTLSTFVTRRGARRPRKVALGHTTFSVATGRSRTLTVVVARAQRARVPRRGALLVAATAVASDAGGQRATTAVTLRLRRPR